MRAKPVQREKIVQQQIVTLLRSLNFVVYVLGTRRRRGDFQGTMQTPGIPDLYALCPLRAWMNENDGGPRQVWIEVKAPGGKRSHEQDIFRDLCHERGVPYLCGDVDDVIEWLCTYGYLRRENVPHYRRAHGRK